MDAVLIHLYLVERAVLWAVRTSYGHVQAQNDTGFLRAATHPQLSHGLTNLYKNDHIDLTLTVIIY